MVDKLEACPFCGGEARLFPVIMPFDADCDTITVQCAGCDAIGANVLVDQDVHDQFDLPALEAEAIAAWNTRSTPTEDARERVKVLEEALAEAGRMPFAAASIPEGYIDGWADCVEHIRNAGVRAALVEARHEADTALGNKETDRHG